MRGLTAITVLVLLLLQVSAVRGDGLRRGPPDSPLRWKDLGEIPGLSEDHALRLARDYLGSSLGDSVDAALHARAVAFTDDDSFGDPCDGRAAWLVEAESVAVSLEQRGEVRVPLGLVLDGDDGRLLAAFTCVTGEWVLPRAAQGASGRPDFESHATYIGYSVRAATGRQPRATVQQVLGSVWGYLREDPSEPGQIIVRPRIASNSHAQTWGNGERTPPGEEGLRWNVVVLGRVTLPGDRESTLPMRPRRPTQTGFVGFIDDERLKGMAGTYTR